MPSLGSVGFGCGLVCVKQCALFLVGFNRYSFGGETFQHGKKRHEFVVQVGILRFVRVLGYLLGWFDFLFGAQNGAGGSPCRHVVLDLDRKHWVFDLRHQMLHS